MSDDNNNFVEKGALNLLESHIQKYIANDLSALGLGDLELIGLEYPVELQDTKGRIDILAESKQENTVYVIEAKRGVANIDAYRQIKGYLEPIKRKFADKRVIGILIASTLDDETEILLRSDNIMFCEVDFVVHAKGVNWEICNTSSETESDGIEIIISRQPRIQIRYKNGEKVVVRDSDRTAGLTEFRRVNPTVPKLRKAKIEIRYVNGQTFVNGILKNEEVIGTVLGNSVRFKNENFTTSYSKSFFDAPPDQKAIVNDVAFLRTNAANRTFTNTENSRFQPSPILYSSTFSKQLENERRGVRIKKFIHKISAIAVLLILAGTFFYILLN